MTKSTKVVIESDTAGRITISSLDDTDTGDGYRIAGPKYSDGAGEPLTLIILDGRNVSEIRNYLREWDRINLPGTAPSEVLELSAAVDEFLGDAADQAAFPQHRDILRNVERSQRARETLLTAIDAAQDALREPPTSHKRVNT